MKIIKRTLGITLMLIAVIGGLYVSGYLLFFKPIVDIIEAIKAGWVTIDIAIGICKIFFGTSLAVMAASLLGVIGLKVFLH